ncbi:hypothetical protein ACROYT_G044235 [Oculina patagonica]
MSERSPSMEWRLEAFENRPSLWKLIEEIVPESERLEIKEALGEDLVDETLDLQNEASTLLEIWQDYREETDKEERGDVNVFVKLPYTDYLTINYYPAKLCGILHDTIASAVSSD